MSAPSVVWDVLCIGRSGVDLYPVQVGVPLDKVTEFGKFLGGSAANVAVTAARQGRRVAIITKTGADPFGRFVRRELDRTKVDIRFVGTTPDQPTPVTFCEIFPPDRFPLYFYRSSCTPDLTVQADDLPRDDIAAARVYWSTLTGLSRQPSRDAHLAAWQARGRTPWTVIDLDYRPPFWDGGENEARAWGQIAVRHCTVAVGNQEECRVATGQAEPLAAAQALLDLGAELAVVKLGASGAVAMTGSQSCQIPSYPVHIVNGLGAGDAFGGALCHGWLSGWETAETLRYANAAGAYVAAHLECAAAAPTPAQLACFMEQWPDRPAADRSGPHQVPRHDSTARHKEC